MKRTKATIAHEAVTAARNIIELLYSKGGFEFEDDRIQQIGYRINDICVFFSALEEEEIENEKNA